MATRDILKSGFNLPAIGPVSIGGILLIGGLGFLLLRSSRKSRPINLKVS